MSEESTTIRKVDGGFTIEKFDGKSFKTKVSIAKDDKELAKKLGLADASGGNTSREILPSTPIPGFDDEG